MKINSPEALDRLIAELQLELQEAGLHEAAGRFAEIQQRAYTTGTEWLGDLQNAAQLIKKGYKIPPALRAKLNIVLAPTFAQRLVARQLWQAVLTANIILILGGSILILALLANQQFEEYATESIVVIVALSIFLFVAVRKVSICPGCSMRIRQISPACCPYCGAQLCA